MDYVLWEVRKRYWEAESKRQAQSGAFFVPHLKAAGFGSFVGGRKKSETKNRY